MQVSEIRKIIKQLLKENESNTISKENKQINDDLITFYTKKINKVTNKVYKKFWLFVNA